MANLRGWQLVILVVLILLLFGSKKLPDAARSLGRSLRIFKAETKALVDEDEKDAKGELTSAEADLTADTATTVDAQVEEVRAEGPGGQQSGSTKNS